MNNMSLVCYKRVQSIGGSPKGSHLPSFIITRHLSISSYSARFTLCCVTCELWQTHRFWRNLLNSCMPLFVLFPHALVMDATIPIFLPKQSRPESSKI